MATDALIAEPDPVRAEAYRHLLASKGLTPEVVSDGAAAWEALARNGPPRVLLAELSLPRMDGFALLRELRRTVPVTTTPVVVVSAFRAFRDEAVKLRSELGISELLAASSPMSSIDRAVERALEQRRGPTPRPSEAPPADVEQRRLDLIAQLGLVDGGSQDEVLQQIVERTARAFHVPIALVSLVLEDRQWFKAHTGLGGKLLDDRGTPREWSFCHHVVDANTPLVIPDATLHPSFEKNPLVREGLVRGYAGAPLVAPSGEVLGTLCIIDTQPLKVGSREVDALAQMARRVGGELELRANAQRSRRERERLAEQLARQMERAEVMETALAYLHAVLAHSDTGTILYDAGRRVVFANARVEELLGVPSAEAAQLTRDQLLARVRLVAEDAVDFDRKLAVPSEGPYAFREQLVIQRVDQGQHKRRVIRWVSKPVSLPTGVGQLALLTEVTAEVALLEQAERLALTDALTGLPNRRAVEELLGRERARSRRDGRPLSVAVFDVDQFKRVNDEHGHDGGDRVLRAVAQALAEAARGSDAVGRFGGEEFLAVLPGIDLGGARIFAERARASVEALRLAGLELRVTTSAGIAQLSNDESVESLVTRADAQLYAAKRGGQNQVR